jgi:hypothetical protein
MDDVNEAILYPSFWGRCKRGGLHQEPACLAVVWSSGLVRDTA